MLLDLREFGAYAKHGITKVKIKCVLPSFPQEVLQLGESLTQIDLSGTGLSRLPSNFGASLPHLKIAFFSDCNFRAWPLELRPCSALEMVAFRRNGLGRIPEGALPPRLRWLILTDNCLTELPRSIGECGLLEKCMLAGNQLIGLPDEMAACRRLALLRLSSNCLLELPDWLFTMPELGFLSVAGNPCMRKQLSAIKNEELAEISWSDLTVHEVLGEGASGVISRATWHRRYLADEGPANVSLHEEEVAIKMFRGSQTSDGTPEDEMAACLLAGVHEGLIGVLGRIKGPPNVAVDNDFKGGIAMQLVPPHYRVLGQPPSLDSCSRDCFADDAHMNGEDAVTILVGIAEAARYLHGKGIMHGDLYAHNVLWDASGGHALLGDFGAATIYEPRFSQPFDYAFEKLEVLAYGYLVEDLVGLVKRGGSATSRCCESVLQQLSEIRSRCVVQQVSMRPSFEEIANQLQQITKAKLPN